MAEHLLLFIVNVHFKVLFLYIYIYIIIYSIYMMWDGELLSVFLIIFFVQCQHIAFFIIVLLNFIY